MSHVAPGPRLEDYRLLGVLGRGATGAVFLAERPVDRRFVALKRLAGDWVDDEARRRFEREERALRRLEHPNIVGSLGWIEKNGTAWLVLEYVDGPSLAQLLQVQPLKTADALAVVESVAVALDFAHRIGVLHRDVTPANVLLRRSGQVKLGDFGVAKIIGPDRTLSLVSFRTASGAVVGTPEYMSPEAAEGTSELSAQADVYSLAVLTYRLLVGRPPFPFLGDVGETLEAQLHRPVPRPGELGVPLPPPLERVLLCGLAKSPNERPAGAAAFWGELCSAADAAWPRWREATDLAAIAAVAAPTHAAGVDEQLSQTAIDLDSLPTTRVALPVFEPRRPRRRPGPLALAALVVGFVAAVTIVSWVLTGPPPLAVRSVALSFVTTTGTECSGSILLTGRVVTNGGSGIISYRWVLSGSPPEPVRTESARLGEATVVLHARLTTRAQKDSPPRGELQVLSPAPVHAARIEAPCRQG